MQRSRNVRRHALTVSIALSLAATTAYAQETQPTQPAPAAEPAAQPAAEATAKTLDAVQVTAQRRVESIQDVPMAITTVNGEKLDIIKAGGEDIRFLAGKLPSLNVESSFGRAFPRFYIRGLGNTDFDLNASQPVSLILDDVVQENPILKGFPLFDIDQVEMARGPQGTLFGRNSPAGVIKFGSARPQQEFGGYGKIGYATYDTINAEGAITGGLSETVSARLSVLHQRRDDWVDNTFNGPGDDLEGYRETAARAQLLFAPSDEFEALANVHMRKLDGTARLFRAGIIRAGTNDLIDGFERDEVSIDGRNTQELDQLGGSLRMRWNLGRTTLYSISGYESVDTYSRGDIDGGSKYTFFTSTPDEPSEGLFPSESADGMPDHRQLSQEFRLESNEWGRFDWQAGLFWFNEDIKVESFSYDGFGGPQNGYATQEQDNTAWAVFASGDFDVTDNFTLRGGLRYTRDEKDFTAQRYGPDLPLAFLGQAPLGPVNRSKDATDVSWDLSGVYEVSDSTNLYARVAKGFRAPSLQGRVLFNPSNDPDENVTIADTETVLSWEAGVKSQLLDNRLRLGAALFHYTVDDLQLTSVGGTFNTAALVNAEKAVGKGVELDLEAYLTDNLLVTLGASYNDTEIQDDDLSVAKCATCTLRDPTDPNNSAAALIDGNPLPQAPKHVYNFTARYGLPFSNGGEFYAYTDWSYRSEVSFFLYESVEFTGKSLLEGGLRVGYSWNYGKYDVALYGRNITNEEAIVGGIDFNNLTGFVNEPRIIGVEFKAGF